MSILTERALEKNSGLDPATFEAGVKAALEAARELINEHETFWYKSTDPSSYSRWLTMRRFANDFYQLEGVAQT